MIESDGDLAPVYRHQRDDARRQLKESQRRVAELERENERLTKLIRWVLGESPGGLPGFPARPLKRGKGIYYWRTTLRELFNEIKAPEPCHPPGDQDDAGADATGLVTNRAESPPAARPARRLPTCSECGLRKKPIGRDPGAAAASGYCDHECPGYRAAPYPGTLWPGEQEPQP